MTIEMFWQGAMNDVAMKTQNCFPTNLNTVWDSMRWGMWGGKRLIRQVWEQLPRPRLNWKDLPQDSPAPEAVPA